MEKQHQLVTQNALCQQSLSFACSILVHFRKTLHESNNISVEHAWLACEQALCLGKGWKTCKERERRGLEPGDKHLDRYSTFFPFKQRACSQAIMHGILLEYNIVPRPTVSSVMITSLLITDACTQWAHNQRQVRALERGEQDWLLQKCGLAVPTLKVWCDSGRASFSLPHSRNRKDAHSQGAQNVNSNKNWQKKNKVENRFSLPAVV